MAFEGDNGRLKRFAEELDALKRRTRSRVGDEDVARLRRLDLFSRSLEISSRPRQALDGR